MRSKRGSRLKLVNEADAPLPLRAIFDDVRHGLGVPSVPLLYRAYAAVPGFLQLHWKTLKPMLETGQFFALGARLCAETYTRAQSYLEIPDLRAEFEASERTETDRVSDVLDYYQYLDPLLILITAAQMQAFGGPVGHDLSRDIGTGSRHKFTRSPQLAETWCDVSGLERPWDEHWRSLTAGFIPEEHRALAKWPQLYQRCRFDLQQLAALPLYADCQFRLAESAFGLVRELPVQVEMGISVLLEAGITDEQISLATKINETLLSAFTSLLLDVMFTRIACEGGSRAPIVSGPVHSAAAGERQGTSQAA